MLHRYAEAIADAEQAVQRAPAIAAYHVDLGYARFWAKDYPAALADLDRAVALDAAQPWTFGYRGRVQRALGRLEAAVADYSQAIALDATEMLFFLWRAQAYAAAGQHAEAEADCTAGLALAGGDARLWAERGWARWQPGVDLLGALSDFTESLHLRPSALAYLGRGLVHRALNHAADAERDFTQFVQRHAVGPIAAIRQLNEAVLHTPEAED
jgi:tetratricopeptide (TPR) repeat protein